jgi:hypothetical protein
MSAPARTAYLLVVVTAVVVALTGCMGAADAYDRASVYEESFDSGAEFPAEPLAARSPAPVAVADALGDDLPPTSEAPTAERLRVYTADLQLSVVSVEQVRRQIMDLVEGAGGYVESSSEDALVVRVPAADFQTLLDEMESFGEIVARSVQTADVTDDYFDLERRLEIAEASRDRLYVLLERATEPEERVAILRDIRRLSEEIERLRSSLDSLSRLIEYSRITVQLRARIQTSASLRDRIPFRWIRRLDPLATTIGEADALIPVELPPEFAVFRSDTQIRAESAEGVRVRIGGRANEPAGDASFWQEALAYHLGPLYRSVEKIDLGALKGIALESKDPNPHVYLIAVARRGDELIVAEVFFPNRASRLAVGDALAAALGEIDL